jgi:CheY-like chemotaxis protein
MKTKLHCVLVIDDDEPTNFFTNMILEESGCIHHIKVVQSGQEALDYLTKSEEPGSDGNLYPSPNLILLDINMPAMNGWEFLEEYRKLSIKHKGNIRTIMLTTSLFPEDKLKAKEIPEISGFENKPLTIEKLEQILQNHFTNNNVSGMLLSDNRRQSGQAAA